MSERRPTISVDGSFGVEVEWVGVSGVRLGVGELGFGLGGDGYIFSGRGVEVSIGVVRGGGSALIAVGGSSSAGAFGGGFLGARLVFPEGFKRGLGLTIQVLGVDVSKASAQYALVGLGRAEPPRSEPPIAYPVEPDPSVGWGSFAYPYLARDPGGVRPHTVFLLAESGDKYYALLALSDKGASAVLEGGCRVDVEVHTPTSRLEHNGVLGVGWGVEPYEALRNMFCLVSERTLLKPRWEKRRPWVADHLGWCSWNALQTEDLSHERIVGIVGGLRGRGVPVKWVLVDDGWESVEGRAQAGLEPDPRKFPGGFEALTRELRGLGVERVGLWHTINIYWRGAHRRFFEELGAPYAVDPGSGLCVPPGDLGGALEFYGEFYRWVRGKGFGFVKVDYQSSLRSLYAGRLHASPRDLKVAQELAAIENGLSTFNCMSMVPESYSYYFESNVVRVSNDYIPFWGASAKLHVYWCFYNSILFGSIAIPDFDMWMSYDPSAKLYAAAAALSAGPIYITDRSPEKTDVGLLGMLVLPDGRLVRVDEPALPTKDSLFTDPYNEPRFLKVSTSVGETTVVGVFNLYRDNIRLSDSVDLSALGVASGAHVVYGVFGGLYGVFDSTQSVGVELDGGDAEILVVAPLRNGKAIIGLKGYMVPPATVRTVFACGDYIVEPLTQGTLLYYRDGGLREERVGGGALKI